MKIYVFHVTKFSFAHLYPTFHPTFKSSFFHKFKMVEKTSAALVLLLNELMDSDDEKNTRGKNKGMGKAEVGSRIMDTFCITKGLRIKDRLRFSEMFRMGAEYVEFILSKISHLISPREISGRPFSDTCRWKTCSYVALIWEINIRNSIRIAFRII